MIATGMQDLSSSNTAVLAAANGKFDPIFQQKVAESSKRKLALLVTIKLRPIVLSLKAQKYNVAYAALKVKLLNLGVKNPDKTAANARRAYVSRLALRRLSKQQ